MVGIPDIRCVMRRQSKCLPASQSRLAPRTSHWRPHLQSRCLHAVGYHPITPTVARVTEQRDMDSQPEPVFIATACPDQFHTRTIRSP
jgi:hypothetical protein